MFRKSRLKFILWTMITVFVIFIALFGIINVSTYVNLCNSADESLVALRNIPDDVPDFRDFAHDSDFTQKYFIVSFDSDGNFEAANTRNIGILSTADAVSYGQAVYSSGNAKGFADSYRYARVDSDDNSCAIYFLDCSVSLNLFATIATVSSYTFLLLYLVVLIVVIFFSGVIFKPIFEANERQKQFITDASHELKTPLTIISANNEIIEMENGKSQFTTSIDNQVQRLKAMTEKLIVLSRINEEKQTLTMVDFSISDKLMEVYSSFSSSFSLHNIKVNLDLDTITYKGNERSLGELFSILFDNAEKYTPKNGNVDISLKMEGKNVKAIFSNSVAEIEKGNLNRVFDRFYRLDSSRNSTTGGSGIGLAIAKEIVNYHKGRISARSDTGKEFIIEVIL